MRSFWRIFWLECLSLVRSWTVAMLLAFAVAWMLVLPFMLQSDGTADGARELYVRYSLGGVFVLLLVALVSAATASCARERVQRRLQLTLVRPVRYGTVVLGKMLAHVLTGALVLLAASVVLCLRTNCQTSCYHVFSPVLPSPQEEAQAMYAAFLKDPTTPDEVRRARKSVILRLLTQRAVDHYQVIPTNAPTTWSFALPPLAGEAVVRMRFAAQYDMRQDVRGTFSLAGGQWRAAVSNITQAVTSIPLAGPVGVSAADGRSTELTFFNDGPEVLMLRPRKDIEVLVPADAFVLNLLRADLELLALLMVVLSLALFLSSALSRPVALFVILVVLLVGAISPTVTEQYPDPLEHKALDRVGLFITRAASELTRHQASLSPLSALSKGDCVEWAEVGRVAAVDAVALPLLLMLATAFVLPRKQED